MRRWSRKTARAERRTRPLYSARLLGDAGGLTRFGACIETLAPGSRSSRKHWREREDKFVFVKHWTDRAGNPVAR